MPSPSGNPEARGRHSPFAQVRSGGRAQFWGFVRMGMPASPGCPASLGERSFCLVWWAFLLFLYLLGIPLSLHLGYIAVFGVAFLYSGNLCSSLYYGVSIYRQLKLTLKPLTSRNPLLVTSLHSREKKSISTHQNSNTSLPNQETLTSH